MTKRYRSILILIFIVISAACLYSCSIKEASDADNDEPSMLEKYMSTLTCVYSGETVAVNKTMTGILSAQSSGDGMTLLGYDNGICTIEFFSAADESTILISLKNMVTAETAAVFGDGAAIFCRKAEWKGVKESYVGYIDDGGEKWKKSLYDIFRVNNDYTTVEMVAYDGSLFVSAGRYLAELDISGEIKRFYTMPYQAGGMFVSEAGVHVYGERFHRLINDGREEDLEDWLVAFQELNLSEIYGASGHDFAYIQDNCVYVYDIGEQKSTKLMDLMNSRVDPYAVRDVCVRSDDEIYLFISGTGIVKYTASDDIALGRDKTVIINTTSSQLNNTLLRSAAEFNAAQSEYRIIYRPITAVHASDGVSGSLDALLVSGEVGDIFELSDIEDVDTYMSKDIPADLYGLGIVTEEDLFGSVRRLFERNGGLYGLPLTFKINVCTASKGTLPDTAEWTLDRFIEEYQKQPLLADEGRSYLLEWLKGSIFERFIDISGGRCYYDSPEFAEIMEWLISIDDREVDMSAILGFGEKIPLIYETEIYGIQDYVKALIQWDGSMDNGYVIGYPSIGGGKVKITTGSYYMVNSSGNTAGAAAFLKYMLSSDVLADELYSRSDIVALKDDMKKRQDRFGDMWMYFSDTRYSHVYTTTTRDEQRSDVVEVQATQELKQKFYDLLDSAAPETHIPSTLEEIFDEEISGYFGGKSIENTVKVLQSRTSLWLAEQGG